MVEVLYQGRKRKVHKGTRGGKYVVVKGEKRYLKSKASVRKKTSKKTSKKTGKRKTIKRKTMKGGAPEYSLASFTIKDKGKSIPTKDYRLVKKSWYSANYVKHKNNSSLTRPMSTGSLSDAPGKNAQEKLALASQALLMKNKENLMDPETNEPMSKDQMDKSKALGRQIETAIRLIAATRPSESASTPSTTSTGRPRSYTAAAREPNYKAFANGLKAKKNASKYGRGASITSGPLEGAFLLDPSSAPGFATAVLSGKPNNLGRTKEHQANAKLRSQASRSRGLTRSNLTSPHGAAMDAKL